MSVWGKIAGAATGYVLGGVPGALLGSLAGHYAIDKTSDKQVVFTIAVIALAAKMTRADGTIHPNELEAVQNVLRVPEREQKNMARVFNLAQEDVAGFDAYAKQVAAIYADNPQVLEDVLDMLFYIAYADGELHPAEEAYLREVARIFATPESHFKFIQARHDTSIDDPYMVLGVAHNAADDDIREAWKAAVRDNHPDRLQARGVPTEVMHIATARMSAINKAWQLIREERTI